MPFQKGNPGRPIGARQKMGDYLFETVLEDLRERGREALKELREKNVAEYFRFISGLLPKEARLDVNGQIAHLSQPVSEVDSWLGETITLEAHSHDAQPVPSGPVLPAPVRAETEGPGSSVAVFPVPGSAGEA